MAYLCEHVLQHLRAVAVINNDLDQRGARLTPGAVKRHIKLGPTLWALVFKAKHGRRMFKVYVLRHEVELLAFARRCG